MEKWEKELRSNIQNELPVMFCQDAENDIVVLFKETLENIEKDNDTKKEVDCCPKCGNVCANCNLGGGNCTCCDCKEKDLEGSHDVDCESNN